MGEKGTGHASPKGRDARNRTWCFDPWDLWCDTRRRPLFGPVLCFVGLVPCSRSPSLIASDPRRHWKTRLEAIRGSLPPARVSVRTCLGRQLANQDRSRSEASARRFECPPGLQLKHRRLHSGGPPAHPPQKTRSSNPTDKRGIVSSCRIPATLTSSKHAATLHQRELCIEKVAGLLTSRQPFLSGS